jgi:hypothetical protein
VIFQDVSGIGDVFVMFVVNQGILTGLRGAKKVKSSSVYFVVRIIGLLKEHFGVGKGTMPSDAPSVMNDIQR